MTERSLPPANWERLLILTAAISLAALLSSCAQLNPLASEPEPAPAQPVAEKKPPPEPIKPPPRSRLYEWYGSDDYVSHIEISVNEQKARFYNGEKEVGWTTVASGVYRHPTPIGTFAVLEKVQNKRSNIYGRIYNKDGKLVKRNAKMGVDTVPEGGRFKGASMPFFMRLTNDGIGMHAGPIPRPGHRASHGCIRMPKKFAPVLYRYVDVGTPVTIKGKGPSYVNYLAKQRKSAPKSAPTAVAQAQPAAAADDAVPAAVKPENSPGTPPPTAPEGVAGVPQSTETTASLPAATAATAATTPVRGQMDVSGYAQSTAVLPSAGSADVVAPRTVAPTSSSPTSAPAVNSLPVPAAEPANSAAAVSEAPASSPAGSSDPVPAPEPGASAPEGVPIEPPTSLPVEGTMDASLSTKQSQGEQPLQVVPTPSPAAVETGTQSEG